MTPPKDAIWLYMNQGLEFKGRSSRSQFWWPWLMIRVVAAILFSLFLAGGGLDWFNSFLKLSDISEPTIQAQLAANAQAQAEIIASAAELSSLSKFAMTWIAILVLVTLVPSMAVSYRRYQDLNLPGWLHFVAYFSGLVLPIIGLIELGFFAQPGSDKPNRFGPPPQ